MMKVFTTSGTLKTVYCWEEEETGILRLKKQQPLQQQNSCSVTWKIF